MSLAWYTTIPSKATGNPRVSPRLWFLFEAGRARTVTGPAWKESPRLGTGRPSRGRPRGGGDQRRRA
ncbi:MAG: hypothetical protein M0C28_30305 [Candidatus Moduliflexus flocculans]|nr:hypothetical protein [Candidatus Moduliflexus flocculans]